MIVSLRERSVTSDRRTSAAIALLGVAIFVLLYAITVLDMPDDTGPYVGDIVGYAQGTLKPSFFWEFGHLFWRPLGYGIWYLTSPLTSLWLHGNLIMEVYAAVIGINFASGVALALLVFAVTRRLGLRRLLALAVTTGVLLCSAVLNYVHSGTAYVPGFVLHLAGVWLILRAVQDRQHASYYAALAGVLLALACDIWFLYILSIPAALVAEAILIAPAKGSPVSQPVRQRFRLVAITLAVTAIAGVTTFLAGIMLAHISSISELQSWIASSGHGVHVQRPLVRFPTGFTRAFFYLGDEGMTMKRFVLGDPYAPVNWAGLIGAGLWKVVLAFITLATLLWYLTRTRDGRPALAMLIVAILPTFGFAFLWETSSPERYLPLYASLIVAASVVLRQRAGMRAAQSVLGIFLLAIAIVNLKSYAGDLRLSAKRSSDRVRLAHEHTLNGGVALVMSFSDPLSAYFEKQPFDPQNEQNALPLYYIFDFATLGGTDWRTGLSCRVLRAWNAGGEAWLSKRLLAERPQPDWGWVENDHPGIRWTDVTRFFGQLYLDSSAGGSDGFVRIARTEKNRAILDRTCSVVVGQTSTSTGG